MCTSHLSDVYTLHSVSDWW